MHLREITVKHNYTTYRVDGTPHHHFDTYSINGNALLPICQDIRAIKKYLASEGKVKPGDDIHFYLDDLWLDSAVIYSSTIKEWKSIEIFQ